MRESGNRVWAVFVLVLTILHLTGCRSKDGIVQPGSYYMRYRAPEYPDKKPFFQWYYYTIKDLEADRYFAFALSQSFCPRDNTNEGTYIMFSMVEKSSGTAFHKYEKWSIDDWHVSDDFHISIPGSSYKIEPVNDGTYHLAGSMTDAARVWFADGRLHGREIDPAINIAWDLTVYRIFGWYGQQDMERGIKARGVISWNTYAHTSEVEGTVTVDGTVYTISRTPRYRAYADMNWGENFPSGSPGIDYMWGWYYAGMPGNTPGEDIGMIAGIGRHEIGGSIGISEGSFADFRFPGGERLSVREIQWKKPNPEDDGKAVVATAQPDDSLESWDIERSDWVSFTDATGTGRIPLRQIVTIQTKKKLVTMDFQSTPEDYNRLLFPHQDYIFSDFEALGVKARITVLNRETGRTIIDFTTNDAGLEFGYNTN